MGMEMEMEMGTGMEMEMGTEMEMDRMVMVRLASCHGHVL